MKLLWGWLKLTKKLKLMYTLFQSFLKKPLSDHLPQLELKVNSKRNLTIETKINEIKRRRAYQENLRHEYLKYIIMVLDQGLLDKLQVCDKLPEEKQKDFKLAYYFNQAIPPFEGRKHKLYWIRLDEVVLEFHPYLLESEKQTLENLETLWEDSTFREIFNPTKELRSFLPLLRCIEILRLLKENHSRLKFLINGIRRDELRRDLYEKFEDHKFFLKSAAFGDRIFEIVLRRKDAPHHFPVTQKKKELRQFDENSLINKELRYLENIITTKQIFEDILHCTSSEDNYRSNHEQLLHKLFIHDHIETISKDFVLSINYIVSDPLSTPQSRYLALLLFLNSVQIKDDKVAFIISALTETESLLERIKLDACFEPKKPFESKHKHTKLAINIANFLLKAYAYSGRLDSPEQEDSIYWCRSYSDPGITIWFILKSVRDVVDVSSIDDSFRVNDSTRVESIDHLTN